MISSSLEGATDGPVRMTSPATQSEEDSNRETRLDKQAAEQNQGREAQISPHGKHVQSFQIGHSAWQLFVAACEWKNRHDTYFSQNTTPSGMAGQLFYICWDAETDWRWGGVEEHQDLSASVEKSTVQDII